MYFNCYNVGVIGMRFYIIFLQQFYCLCEILFIWLVVVIEEISDDNKHENDSIKPKQQKEKNQLSNSRDDDDKSLKQIVVTSDNGVPVLESEDEDGFPISSQHKSKTDIQKNKKIREREIKKKKKAAAEDDDAAALYGGLERSENS